MKIVKLVPENDFGIDDGNSYLSWKGSYYSWVEEKYATNFSSEKQARLIADSFTEVKGRYTID